MIVALLLASVQPDISENAIALTPAEQAGYWGAATEFCSAERGNANAWPACLLEQTTAILQIDQAEAMLRASFAAAPLVARTRADCSALGRDGDARSLASCLSRGADRVRKEAEARLLAE